MSIINELVSQLSIAPAAKIVDIGCGAGELIYELKDRFDYLIGLDISGELLNIAKHRLSTERNTNSKMSFFLASADRLPFKAQSFEIAVYSEILEHIDNTDKVLDEASHILKQGGILLISIPVYWVEEIITSLNKDFIKYSGHVKRFRLNEIMRLLSEHGFEVILKKNYYFEWTLICTLEAIFSKKFSGIDRRRNYEIISENYYWDRFELIIKRIVRLGQKIYLAGKIIDLLNFIIPKSYIFLCKKKFTILNNKDNYEHIPS